MRFSELSNSSRFTITGEPSGCIKHYTKGKYSFPDGWMVNAMALHADGDDEWTTLHYMQPETEIEKL